MFDPGQHLLYKHHTLIRAQQVLRSAILEQRQRRGEPMNRFPFVSEYRDGVRNHWHQTANGLERTSHAHPVYRSGVPPRYIGRATTLQIFPAPPPPPDPATGRRAEPLIPHLRDMHIEARPRQQRRQDERLKVIAPQFGIAVKVRLALRVLRPGI